MKLIQAEHLKILHKKNIYFIFGGIILAVVLIGLIEKSIVNHAGVDENFIGFLSFSSGFLLVVQLLILPIAGTMVSKEFEQGTAVFLLVRPASRSKILFSKYLTTLLFGVYLIIFYFVMSLIVGILLFGFTEIDGAGRWIRNLALNYLTGSIKVIMISSLAFAISTIFRSSVLAIGFPLLLALSEGIIVQLMSEAKIGFGKYLVFANTNFHQYLGGEPLFEGMTFSFSFTVLVAYLMIYIGSAWFVFLKRDVTH